MNGLRSALAEIRALERGLADMPSRDDILVCPPATLIAEAVKTVGAGPITIGGQDCHAEASGPFTGDTSAEMLRDAGAAAVILGHSERRQHHGESDAIVAAKARAARRAGLLAIICVGESETQREAGQAVAVVTGQLKASIPPKLSAAELVIAYEPIWAIGTGRTPKSAEIADIHQAIRAMLAGVFGAEAANIRILYGGSVKPDNAGAILALPNVDGALIGGASLKAADFLAIIRAAPRR